MFRSPTAFDQLQVTIKLQVEESSADHETQYDFFFHA